MVGHKSKCLAKVLTRPGNLFMSFCKIWPGAVAVVALAVTGAFLLVVEPRFGVDRGCLCSRPRLVFAEANAVVAVAFDCLLWPWLSQWLPLSLWLLLRLLLLFDCCYCCGGCCCCIETRRYVAIEFLSF